MARQVNVALRAVAMVVAALAICANADENELDAGSHGEAARTSRFLIANPGGRGVARNTVNFCGGTEHSCKDILPRDAKNPQCCHNFCVDVGDADRFNCGACGQMCSNGYFCCNGICMSEHNYDDNNCGECGRICEHGVQCQLGMCGYAHGHI